VHHRQQRQEGLLAQLTNNVLDVGLGRDQHSAVDGGMAGEEGDVRVVLEHDLFVVVLGVAADDAAHEARAGPNPPDVGRNVHRFPVGVHAVTLAFDLPNHLNDPLQSPRDGHAEATRRVPRKATGPADVSARSASRTTPEATDPAAPPPRRPI
jgi:hypothetical protein